MIRRPNSRLRWTRERRLLLVVATLWLLLLLLGDYHMSSTVAKKDDLFDRVAVPEEQLTQNDDGKREDDEEEWGFHEKDNEEKHVKQQELHPPIHPDKFREFYEALDTYRQNMHVVEKLGGDPQQTTANFTDIIELPGRGVPLPYDASHEEDPRRWQACDPRNAEFTVARDQLCQAYLSNLNNARYIKAMSSRLTQGRTIKFRLSYAHNGIEAIVKVSQNKFFFEASSEFIAYSVDRALNMSRVPTSAFALLPLDYMRVATSYSPLFSQWIDGFVFQYNYTQKNFVSCNYPTRDRNHNSERCAHVTLQLWMHDVHSALSTFLALPYEYDSAFAAKYYAIGHIAWPPKLSRLRAVGDLLDRFMFDFIIGNSDRGMNDHNNFVYGGCSYRTTCSRPPPAERTKGVAKLAFIDHGSSLYSHQEVKGNPFTGKLELIPICRFRRKTYESLRRFGGKKKDDAESLVMQVRTKLSPAIFRVTRLSVLEKMQSRTEKLLSVIEQCLSKYQPEDVFSLPEYWEINIPEEAESAPLVEDADAD